MTEARPGILIAPSLLAADFGHLADEIKRAEDAGADRLHVDVMDGHFVPNITMGPFVVEAAKRHATVPLDVHLMIEEPLRYLKPFAEAGANFLTFHQEVVDDVAATAQAFREAGVRPGVSINPETPVETILDMLDVVDQVLVMTVQPGFGGQSFMPENLQKIRRIRERRPTGIYVEVDGGVNNETGAQVCAAGADVLVAGTFLFRSEDMKEALESLRRACAVQGT